MASIFRSFNILNTNIQAIFSNCNINFIFALILRHLYNYMNNKTIILLFFISLFSSCKLIDKPEEIPSFIKIESIDLQINSSNEGSSSNAIYDAWVYVDGNLEGVYELPADKIPINDIGEHDISIYAGIKKNGVNGDRKKYPFFTPFEQNINLIADSIIEIFPIVEYEDNLYFWIEDFEDPQTRFDSFISSDTNIYIVSSPSSELFEGDAGAITMKANNYYCEIRTNELNLNNLPTNVNVPAYLELDYKCNQDFTIGILHKDNSLPAYQKQALITLFPTTNNNGIDIWNKTYLYLSDATSITSSATQMDIYMSVLNNTARDDIEIRLDNIKVIF